MEAQVRGLFRGSEIDRNTSVVGRDNPKPLGEGRTFIRLFVPRQRFEFEGNGSVLALQSVNGFDEAEEMGTFGRPAVDLPKNLDVVTRMVNSKQASFRAACRTKGCRT